MHKIEAAIQTFLENIETATVEPYMIEEFGERCKLALRECLLAKRREEPFRLRMSNIGKPLRQLMLEKEHGREPMDSTMRLRMTYGYIWESFLVFLLRAAGLKLETDKFVALNVAYDTDRTTTINGKLDLKIDGEIYDTKSASSYSYNNKFASFDSLRASDDFGYVGQALGYSIADKSHFGGWIVIDKNDGRIKVVEVPKEGYRELAREHLDDFKHKIKTLNTEGAAMPSCPGVIAETFRRAPTGNLILNKSCEYCSCKYKCHPELQYKESLTGEAKTKAWKYYVKISEPIQITEPA